MQTGVRSLLGSELRAFSAWCAGRNLSWCAAPDTGIAPSMLLQPRDAGAAWQRMLVVLDEREMRLENEMGETLACASDLPALLDAVDGGIADRMPRPSGVLAGLAALPIASLLGLVF